MFEERFDFDPLDRSAENEGDGTSDSGAPKDMGGSGYVAAE